MATLHLKLRRNEVCNSRFVFCGHRLGIVSGDSLAVMVRLPGCTRSEKPQSEFVFRDPTPKKNQSSGDVANRQEKKATTHAHTHTHSFNNNTHHNHQKFKLVRNFKHSHTLLLNPTHHRTCLNYLLHILTAKFTQQYTDYHLKATKPTATNQATLRNAPHS